jgi:hypothetical protein
LSAAAAGRFDTSIHVVAVVLACSLLLPLIAKRPQAKDSVSTIGGLQRSSAGKWRAG